MNTQISSPLQNEPAIHVKNLSKVFKIYARPLDMVREFLTSKPRHRPFQALDDISFEVQKGQVVGLLGRNGAGKSTLLRIIAGTLDASSGDISVNGRVSSILELGTGFNREYSGRENIFMGGLIAGLSVEEIKEKEDWIIEFSELRDFIDQPFKTFSSGMQARLTFSTAICVDPDILIVDEALSVGDARFQRKSFGKIEDFRKSGKTILFVSHDMNSIRSICDVAILLEKGKILEMGEPDPVSKKYWKMLYIDKPNGGDASADNQDEEDGKSNGTALTASIHTSRLLRAGSRQEAEVVDIGILDNAGDRVNLLESGKNYSILLKALFHQDVETIGAGFHIANEKGVIMYGLSTTSMGFQIPSHKKGQVLELRLNVTMWLTNGTYLLSGGIGNGETPFDFLYDAVEFVIPRLPGIQHASVVNLEPKFEFSNTTFQTDGI